MSVNGWNACIAVALCTGVAVCSGGCGKSGPLVVVNKSDPTRDRLIQLGFAYREACARAGRAPKGMAELQPVMKDVGVSEDQILSLRDGKPFEIVWGISFPMMPDTEKPPVILAHEASSQDGMRYVLWNIGTTELLSDEKFNLAR